MSLESTQENVSEDEGERYGRMLICALATFVSAVLVVVVSFGNGSIEDWIAAGIAAGLGPYVISYYGISRIGWFCAVIATILPMMIATSSEAPIYVRALIGIICSGITALGVEEIWGPAKED